MVVPGSHQWCETREQSLSETGRRGLWLVCKGTPAQWDVQSKGHSVMGRGWQGCLPHGSQGPGLPPLVSTVVPLLHPHGQKSAHTPGSVLNSDLDSERLRQLPVVAQPRSALIPTLGHPPPSAWVPTTTSPTAAGRAEDRAWLSARHSAFLVNHLLHCAL